MRHCFYLKTLRTFYLFKIFYIKRLLKFVISCKVFYFFELIKDAIKNLIIKPFVRLLNTIPLTRTKQEPVNEQVLMKEQPRK